MFEKETEAVAEKVMRIVEDKNLSVKKCMEKINVIEKKVKHKSFGKTRKTQAGKKLTKVHKCPKCRGLGGQSKDASGMEGQLDGGRDGLSKAASRMEDQQDRGMGEGMISSTRLDTCDGCYTQAEEDEVLLKEQGDKLEKEINQIKAQGKGRLTRIFRMKQKVLGGKKVGQEPSAVRDPSTGDLMVSSSDIKRTTLQYCIDNLKNNKASKNVEVIQKLKEFMHKLRMLEDNHD